MKANFARSQTIETPQMPSFGSVKRSTTFDRSFTIVQKAYTQEDVILMKDRMIDYLKSENERLMSEIQNGSFTAYSVPDLIAKPSGFNIPIGHVVIVCIVAVMFGFIAGSY